MASSRSIRSGNASLLLQLPDGLSGLNFDLALPIQLSVAAGSITGGELIRVLSVHRLDLKRWIGEHPMMSPSGVNQLKCAVPTFQGWGCTFQSGGSGR